jgi:multimeric flavodoxin WrbA
MNVLGIYASPRKGGNSDQLLDRVLDGVQSTGETAISRIYVRELKINGCRECGGCEIAGQCVHQDDMQKVYPLLTDSKVIFLSTPIFFYNVPSQVKALIDRCQALWSKRRLEKSPEERKTYEKGRGYLIAVGATKGENLFEGVQLTARYFYDALDMSYEGGIFFRSLDKKGAVQDNPETLQEAFNLGRKVMSV